MINFDCQFICFNLKFQKKARFIVISLTFISKNILTNVIIGINCCNNWHLKEKICTIEFINYIQNTRYDIVNHSQTLKYFLIFTILSQNCHVFFFFLML